MRITQAPSFSRSVKKLHPNQKKALDKAVKEIAANPNKGDEKTGDLLGVYIFKFKIANLQWLLAYRLETEKQIKLLVVGPHENFYRDIKKSR